MNQEPNPQAPVPDDERIEEILNIPLHHHYTPEEWNRIFDQFTDLLGNSNAQIRERAVERIATALTTESGQIYWQKDFEPASGATRLAPILCAITQQEQKTPGILEDFCFRAEGRGVADDEEQRNAILQWLNELAENKQFPSLSPEMLLAARICFKFYGTSWAEAKTSLLATLDHPDLLVRACAAYQLGQFYCQGDDQMPPINEMMQLIRDKEIERPGIAGAFRIAIRFDFEEIQERYGTNIDIKEWIFDILETQKSPEPYIKHFSNGIDFEAHELFAGDAVSLRRLLQLGRVDIAIEAATEINGKIEEIEPILMELGNHTDPNVVKLACWHLADNYHRLHPRGEELGFVQLIWDLEEIDIFLKFTEYHPESPYAAIIYPKQDKGLLDDEIAWKWVNRILPDSLRGHLTPPDFPGCVDATGALILGDNVTYQYQRAYVAFCASPKGQNQVGKMEYQEEVPQPFQDFVMLPERQEWERVIIGYHSKTPWNPRQLLQLR